MIKVIALANRKGSVGETTAAVNPEEIIYSTDSCPTEVDQSLPQGAGWPLWFNTTSHGRSYLLI